jgi:hypothetical protein
LGKLVMYKENASRVAGYSRYIQTPNLQSGKQNNIHASPARLP